LVELERHGILVEALLELGDKWSEADVFLQRDKKDFDRGHCRLEGHHLCITESA
jgi:hypothetical protein